MPTTVQLNTRIDPLLKRQGDAVFARAGLSSSDVVRRLWSHAAATQSVPNFLLPEADDRRAKLVEEIRQGAGIVRTQAELMGISLGRNPIDYDSLRDEMYDDLTEKINGDLAAS